MSGPCFVRPIGASACGSGPTRVRRTPCPGTTIKIAGRFVPVRNRSRTALVARRGLARETGTIIGSLREPSRGARRRSRAWSTGAAAKAAETGARNRTSGRRSQ